MLLEHGFDVLLNKNEESSEFAHQISIFVCIVNFEPPVGMGQQLFSHFCCNFADDFLLKKVDEVANHHYMV